MLVSAFVVVLVLSGVITASAFAGEWLVSGLPIAAKTVSETKGALILTDLLGVVKVGVTMVECAGAFNGSVGPGAADEISEVLNASKELIGKSLAELALECKAVEGCSSSQMALVWPLNLPWTTEVELMSEGASEFLDKLLSAAGKEPAWELECNIAGVREVDTCTSEGKLSAVLRNAMAGVEEIFSLPEQEANKELEKCTLGGAEEGHISGTGTTTISTGSLSVS